LRLLLSLLFIGFCLGHTHRRLLTSNGSKRCTKFCLLWLEKLKFYLTHICPKTQNLVKSSQWEYCSIACRNRPMQTLIMSTRHVEVGAASAHVSVSRPIRSPSGLPDMLCLRKKGTSFCMTTRIPVHFQRCAKCYKISLNR